MILFSTVLWYPSSDTLAKKYKGVPLLILAVSSQNHIQQLHTNTQTHILDFCARFIFFPCLWALSSDPPGEF